MKRTLTVLLPLALLAVILAITSQALAQGGGYTLLRAVTSNNAVIAAQNRDYQLKAAIGQPFAGSPAAGNTQLGAGYWYGFEAAAPTGRKQYLPLTRR
jgi:hypothetical protein